MVFAAMERPPDSEFNQPRSEHKKTARMIDPV
jgi:hypothetical protein